MKYTVLASMRYTGKPREEDNLDAL